MLLFIFYFRCYFYPVFSVSIHLMLLFINRFCKKTGSGKWVSIHLMLLFIVQERMGHSSIKSFNTSHVVVYRRRLNCGRCSCIVSIHLMLLFISIHIPSSLQSTFVSIHLMLLFIGAEKVSQVSKLVSIHLMLLFIIYCR